MAKQTFLYELLIRLGPDGYVGGHAVDLVRFTDDTDGELIADRESPPRAVTLQEASDLLGAESAALLVQLSNLTAELAAAQGRAEQAEAAAEVATARADVAESALQAVQSAAPAPQAEEA